MSRREPHKRAADGRRYGQRAGSAAVDWYCSPRFRKDVRRASPVLARLVAGELGKLQRHAAAQVNWIREYDSVASIDHAPVVEVDVGGGPRMLVQFDGRSATLLTVGKHAVVGRYARDRRLLPNDLLRRVALPRDMLAGSGRRFFPSDEGELGPFQDYANEADPAWIYFLDQEQHRTSRYVIKAIEAALLSDNDPLSVQLIVGGPRTGKTSILLQLLMQLSDEVIPNNETWNVGLRVSDQVARYISSTTGWNLAECRHLGELAARPQVLLIDDPASLDSIEWAVADAEHSGLRALVCAFDPLQFEQSVNDAEYRRLLDKYNAEEGRLRSCYRQKREVGRVAFNAVEMVAASSPFLDETKKATHRAERANLTTVANTVTFPNPSGHARTYRHATYRQWSLYLHWIQRQRSLRRHWPPLLISSDPLVDLPGRWLDAAADIGYDSCSLDALSEVKGVEYQHVSVLLSAQRYRDVEQGFTGSGRRLYDDYRLLRIPFTRGRDSLAVFVFEASS